MSVIRKRTRNHCQMLYLFHLCLSLLLLASIGQADSNFLYDANSGPPVPGIAGYALIFHDNVIVKKDFKDFPEDALTFEAWISTSDFCHPGAVMSYAVKTDSHHIADITRAANHFVIFDVKNVLACHDFEFIDIIPDYMYASCHAHFNQSVNDLVPTTGQLVNREGKWRHLAVTWTKENEGETIIYIDGVLAGRAITHKKNPIGKKGAFMLGGEQDCFGGCTDPKQGFYGLMDEVRIWKTVRTQNEIMRYMRSSGAELQNHEHLVAYWKFDDPGTSGFDGYGILTDSSGRGNDLDILIPPMRSQVRIEKKGTELLTHALTFKNSYAMNPQMDKIPTKDITVEFWARSGVITGSSVSSEHYAEFFSFANIKDGEGMGRGYAGYAGASLIDDAIRIERYLTEYNETQYLKNAKVNTLGSISVHINSNREGNGRKNDNWLDFATDWTDGDWHHIALTWEYNTGETNLYFDGKRIIPFWRAHHGDIDDKDISEGGVPNILAAKVQRGSMGSLILGQNQECYAGCLSPSSAFDGSLANVRVWSRVLDKGEIEEVMFQNDPSNKKGLALNFKFDKNKFHGSNERSTRVYDQSEQTYLQLGSQGPGFQFSTVPLTNSDGTPGAQAKPGYNGYALELNDQQLLMLRSFKDFPSDKITVEFWMWSVDSCRQGVPFSYANGEYQTMDNAFLIFDYNDWGIAVMEEEGALNDHNAGFSSTDGKWHHIAVTWESQTGKAIFYDNGRVQWEVERGLGKKLPSGGTLVIGREQDCLGGCFDSAPGAIGDTQPVRNLEYGPQDFYGIIEEMRVWKTVRTQEEIVQGMAYDKDNGSGKPNEFISKRDKNLVAWWKFDEGKGYKVKDETGGGHDLSILSEPKWVVPRWVETCGDGILEASEDCDDGNRRDGDGCDSHCVVESGWKCSFTNPSACYIKSNGGDKSGRVFETSSGSYDNYGDSSSSSSRGNNHKSHNAATGFIIFLFVMLALVAVGIVAYMKRDAIYEQVPGLRNLVLNSQDRLNQALGRNTHRYNLTTVDPEEVYVSPGFVDSQPPASNQASTASVPYEPIRDGKTFH